MKKPKTGGRSARDAMMELIERPKPEPYSFTVAVRVRKSEKDAISKYAADHNVNIDTVLRSALIAAGVLAA